MRQLNSMTVRAFYDELAQRYHLVYQDWDASVARQAKALDSLLREFFPRASTVFDVAAGIGTQSLGLRAMEYDVVGSDLSEGALRRIVAEARARGLELPVYAADFQRLPLREASIQVVLCGDNSLPHLESAEAVHSTLAEWHRCLRPGGGCLISMRDYGEPRIPGTIEDHPYGARVWNGRRYDLAQRWTWRGAQYDVTLTMTALEENTESIAPITTTYSAICPAEVLQLMSDVGFELVQRLDGRLFQPVLIGFKALVP